MLSVPENAVGAHAFGLSGRPVIVLNMTIERVARRSTLENCRAHAREGALRRLYCCTASVPLLVRVCWFNPIVYCVFGQLVDQFVNDFEPLLPLRVMFVTSC